MPTLLKKALACLDALEVDRQAALALSKQKAEEEAGAGRQSGKLIDRVATGPPVLKFLLVEARSGMRGCHSPGSGRITAERLTEGRAIQRQTRPSGLGLEEVLAVSVAVEHV